MTPIDENTFQEAAKETAQNIANTWETWYQSMSDNNALFSMPSDTHLQKTSLSHTIEPVSKTYQIENQQREMNRAGLSSTELPFSSSSLFETQNTQTDIDLPPSLPPSLDPNSPAYITQLYEALGLSPIKGFDHRILTGDAPPVYRLPYRKSPAELKAIKDELQRMLAMNIISESKSPWGSPVILVRKPPEKGKPVPPRFVVDYRQLNSVTLTDGY